MKSGIDDNEDGIQENVRQIWFPGAFYGAAIYASWREIIEMDLPFTKQVNPIGQDYQWHGDGATTHP